MLSVFEDFIRRHRDSGVLVDTNILLVYLVGKLNQEWIGRVAGGQAYDANDFALLSLALEQFQKVIVTPAVLAEVSNLAASRLTQSQCEKFLEMLRTYLPSHCVERNVDLPNVCATALFSRLGFTDATLEELSRGGVPVFTDDANLHYSLSSQGFETFNYNHIRYFALSE